MRDIRLQEAPFEYKGKTYLLRCNFNVLADMQEEYGDIPDIREGLTMKAISFIIASMMNDYADEQGWPERVTAKQVGRELNIGDMAVATDVVNLMANALFAEKGEAETEPSKN